MSERDEWPDLRVVVRPLPWTWRFLPRLYHDDVEGWRGHCSFAWLFLTVEWWANKPMFRAVSPLTDADQETKP